MGAPINIVPSSAQYADPGAITLTDYDSEMNGKISNNEHTIVFTFTDGTAPSISGGRLPPGDTFEFAQLHWHWGSVNTQGSEHTLDGKEYPAEVHLVHFNKKYGTIGEAVSKSDGLAVLGFFYELSSTDNGNLVSMLDVVDQVKRRQRSLNEEARAFRNKNKNKKNSIFRADSTEATVSGTIRLDQLLPVTGLPTDYYYYSGSLTTPTCDESVLWTVFEMTVPISETQLNVFRTLKDSSDVTLSDNYRPPQPLNSRTVYKRIAPPSSADAAAMAVGAGAIGAVIGRKSFNTRRFLPENVDYSSLYSEESVLRKL